MIQEYDFDIEHVAGEDNVVADAFSRLMAMPKDLEVMALLASTNVLTKVPEDKHAILSKIHTKSQKTNTLSSRRSTIQMWDTSAFQQPSNGC